MKCEEKIKKRFGLIDGQKVGEGVPKGRENDRFLIKIIHTANSWSNGYQSRIVGQKTVKSVAQDTHGIIDSRLLAVKGLSVKEA